MIKNMLNNIRVSLITLERPFAWSNVVWLVAVGLLFWWLIDFPSKTAAGLSGPFNAWRGWTALVLIVLWFVYWVAYEIVVYNNNQEKNTWLFRWICRNTVIRIYDCEPALLANGTRVPAHYATIVYIPFVGPAEMYKNETLGLAESRAEEIRNGRKTFGRRGIPKTLVLTKLT